jgi:tetratricopeptide (TPR) repeat protein
MRRWRPELARIARARREERRGRLHEAERLYREALAARPDWLLAAVPLARLLVARAEPSPAAAIAEARAILSAPRAAQPSHVLVAVVEAELLIAEDRADEAKALLVAARTPDGPRVVTLALARAENALGIALAAADRGDEAAFAFKRACDLDADWAPPRVNLGALWQRLGRPRQALEQFRRALALDPRHPVAHYNLGLLHRDAGDLTAAAREFGVALDCGHAGAADALRHLALRYAHDGQLLEAAELWRRAEGNSGPPAASK